LNTHSTALNEGLRMKRLFETYPALGFSLAGFCAGLLALFLLIVLVLLALLLFNLVFTTVSELAAARAAGKDLPMNWGTIGVALTDALINLGRIVWDARLGLLAVGILGLLAAWGHQMGQAIDPTWGRPASALVMVLVVTFSTTTWVFAQWAQIAEWLAQSPELYVTRDLFAGSALVDLVVSILLGLLAAAPLWMLWHQGYTWLTHAWLPISYPSPNLSAPVADDYRRYTTRLHDLKRGDRFEDEPATPSASRPRHAYLQLSWFRLSMGLIALLILASGSTWLVQNAYRGVAIRLEHQTLYLRAANQPVARHLLHLDDDVRDLTIVNIDGAGSVEIALTGGSGCNDVIRPPERWVFVRRQGEYLHSTLPLAGLPPGVYCLELHQKEGWGMYEYTLSHGGGRISHQLALATGLLTATTLIGAIGLLVLTLLRIGVIAPAPYRSVAPP
jgi:hypothetical protein